MADEGKYDSAFYGILQNEGNIASFLDSIFDFLYRRTDFYLIMKEKDGKFGFPPGVALKHCVAAFRKYEELAKKVADKKEKLFEKQTSKAKSEPMETQSPPAEGPPKQSELSIKNITKPVAPKSEHLAEHSGVENQPMPEEQEKPQDDRTEKDADKVRDSEQASKTTKESEDSTDSKPPAKSEQEDDDPELTRLQKEFQSNPDSYNGAIRENYLWSQSITDADVKVKVPSNIRRGKDVQVVIERKHLRVAYRGEGGDWVVMIDDHLNWEINKEESMWSIEPGKHIQVNLEKVQERWWEAVIQSEPHISVRKIDPSRPMSDLDNEAQSKIEEMMYNERQKKLGLPQSHEKKVHNMLRQAWDAEGSPFKGQDFDPTKFNVAPGSGMM